LLRFNIHFLYLLVYSTPKNNDSYNFPRTLEQIEGSPNINEKSPSLNENCYINSMCMSFRENSSFINDKAVNLYHPYKKGTFFMKKVFVDFFNFILFNSKFFVEDLRDTSRSQDSTTRLQDRDDISISSLFQSMMHKLEYVPI